MEADLSLRYPSLIYHVFVYCHAASRVRSVLFSRFLGFHWDVSLLQLGDFLDKQVCPGERENLKRMAYICTQCSVGRGDRGFIDAPRCGLLPRRLVGLQNSAVFVCIRLFRVITGHADGMQYGDNIDITELADNQTACTRKEPNLRHPKTLTNL